MYLMLSVMHLLHYRHQIGDSLGVLSCSVYQVIGPISFRLWEVRLKKKKGKTREMWYCDTCSRAGFYAFFLFSVASLPHYRQNSTFSIVLNLLFLSFDLSDNVE